MREHSSKSASVAGFTFVELLIVVIILGVVMLLGFPALQNMVRRGKIEGLARETSLLMQEARFAAIRHTVRTSVIADLAGGRIFATRDRNGNGQRDEPGDHVIGSEVGFSLPAGVEFGGPGGAIDGFDADASHGWVVFETDGSVAKAGGIRLADRRDNFLEIRVEPKATARVFLRKWDGAAWREQGELNRSWAWN
jgi:prepilin-type N-terminal cleavage/methylation domain-containing protein